METTKHYFCIFLMAITFFACKKDGNDPDNPGDPSAGLHVVDGRYLADACGDEVILRGVNIGNVYEVNLGVTEIDEAAKTGANSLRLVLQRRYTKWQNGIGTEKDLEVSEVETLVRLCLNKGIIPVLELHDFTGSSNAASALQQAVSWWTGGAMKAMLQKYQRSIIINIANEPENGSAAQATYRETNSSAVRSLRDAGYTCPLMIDASNWGKDHTFFVNEGQALMQSDPLKNLLFSVHAYWPTIGAFGNYSDNKITADMQALKNSNLPITIGELAHADVQNNTAYAINYRLLMQLCGQHKFGYLCWWWGSTNAGSNNVLSMTGTGYVGGLTAIGKIIAETDANAIGKTSKGACGIGVD